MEVVDTVVDTVVEIVDTPTTSSFLKKDCLFWVSRNSGVLIVVVVSGGAVVFMNSNSSVRGSKRGRDSACVVVVVVKVVEVVEVLYRLVMNSSGLRTISKSVGSSGSSKALSGSRIISKSVGTLSEFFLVFLQCI